MQTISKEDIQQRIRTENPWWQDSRKVSSVEKQRGYFNLFYPLVKDRSVRRAVVLMGPRRVGKTVMIHHAVKKLIEEGVPPQTICYISVDNPIYTGLGLEKLLDYYGQASGVDYKTQPVYIFFDEIQYLRNWEVHLKSAVDTYEMPKFIVSGSAAAALRLKSNESGAGRFTDFLLPPLTFSEYLDLLGKTNLIAVRTDGASSLVEVFKVEDIEKANEEFIKYINFGGYPEVIFSESIQKDPTRFIKSDIIDKVLLRDLPSLYGVTDIQELNRLFTTLALNTANEVSLEGLSQNSGVTKNTIKRYIEYLEAAFLIKRVYRIDEHGKRFKRENYFKVYLTNPSMYAALFGVMDAEDDRVGHLVETAVFSQWFHFPDTYHYARWPQGEVDMISLGTDGKPQGATEVKWSDRECDNPNLLKHQREFIKKNHLNKMLVTTRTREERKDVDGIQINYIQACGYCFAVGRALQEALNNRGAVERMIGDWNVFLDGNSSAVRAV